MFTTSSIESIHINKSVAVELTRSTTPQHKIVDVAFNYTNRPTNLSLITTITKSEEWLIKQDEKIKNNDVPIFNICFGDDDGDVMHRWAYTDESIRNADYDSLLIKL